MILGVLYFIQNPKQIKPIKTTFLLQVIFFIFIENFKMNRFRITTIFLLAVTSSLLNYSCYGQSTSKIAKLDSLFQGLEKSYSFNGNVLIAEKKKVIYEKTFGKADLSGTTKLTKDYRFHIGSIAKEFNAVAILMLKEQGKLKLDDSISKFLPELPAWANKIKIINLLQYTSGLPQIKWNEVNQDSDNMEYLKKTLSLDFEPGTKYDYNNNNVFLQRRIIEKISNMPFNSFVIQKILKPIGIKNGLVDPDKNQKLFAKSFNNWGKEDQIKYNISGWTALNLEDFYKWSKAINTFKLIDLSSTVDFSNAFCTDCQTGLGQVKIENGKIISHIHDGAAFNYQALLISNPDFTIILMTNNKQNNLGEISTTIESILK
jgi:CubicO group peptidase (beta-lactamase class C family)